MGPPGNSAITQRNRATADPDKAVSIHAQNDLICAATLMITEMPSASTVRASL
jgi:hypothetical protein